MERYADRRIAVVTSIEEGARPKDKTLDYSLVDLPTLTNGDGLWVMAEDRGHKQPK